MAFKMKIDKGKFDFGNKITFNIGKKFQIEKPKFKSKYKIGGESGSQGGITLPSNAITRASGDLSYGTSKRNINLSGGLDLPTGKGNLTLSGKTNIGKRTSVNASIATSSGSKPTYSFGITRKFGRRNKKRG